MRLPALHMHFQLRWLLHALRGVHEHQVQAPGQHGAGGCDELEAGLRYGQVLRGAGDDAAGVVEPVVEGG